MSLGSAVRRLARSPLLQIAAVAALVYVSLPVASPRTHEPPPLPIRIAADDYESAVWAWEKVRGVPPNDRERELILDRLAADEALFRRALELGLDDTPITNVRLKQLANLVNGVDEHGSRQDLADDLRGRNFATRDPILRGHLIQTMKLVAKKVEVPSGDELASFYALERERFVRPAMYEVRQVYFSFAKRGDSARSDASQALRGLLRDTETDPSTLGDRFNAGSRFSMRPAARIGSALGEQAARAIETAPSGEWIGPVESAFGWHLLRLDDARPPESPRLATISSEVLHTYLRIRGEEKLARTLRSLRLRYGVEVERL